MTRLASWILLLVLVLVLHARPAAAQGLHARVSAALKEEALGGAVWATLAPDGTISADAAGLKHASTGTPLKADDKVQVGSITKTLLATGILRLVSEGRLDLDAPLAGLLPDLLVDNPWAADHPLRLRHLIDHTAGLDDARLWQAFSLRVSPDAPLSQAISRAPTNSLRLRSRPGSAFSYSNTSYTLLGMVVEALTGERYERYLDRHLLAPLGMTESTFGFVTQAADARLAMGHFEHGVPHPAVPTYLRPAAQFTTTARDMALFARFLLGDGSIAGQPFIAPQLLRAMGQPRGTDAARAGLMVGNGLGLVRRDRHGAVGLCHGGSTVGFRAMLCLYPETGQAFFIAFNTDSETADHGRFDALLIRHLGLPKAEPVKVAAVDAQVADWQGIYVPSPSRFETFAYLDFVLNYVSVDWDGLRLLLRTPQSNDKLLSPVGGRLFRAEGRLLASHALLITSDGDRAFSDGLQSYRQVSLWQIAPLWLSLAGGLLGLAWIVIAGLIRAMKRSLAPAQPLFFPFVATIALLIPLPLFLRQSFLALGDLTTASAVLAVVTGLLPLAMVVGLVRGWRRGPWFDTWAMAAVLQWTAVLAWWGLLPLRLWS